jgi:hypothetical protein
MMSDTNDYREMARRLRARATIMKSRGTRADLRWLAAEYEAQAARLTATAAPTKAGEQGSIKGKR